MPGYFAACQFSRFLFVSYGIRPPYKTVLDGEFIQAALDGQIMLKEQFPKIMQDEKSMPYVTKCIDEDLRKLGKKGAGALAISTSLPHLKCRHTGGFKPTNKCISLLIANNNPDHLCVGAQNEELRNYVHRKPGIPVLHIVGNTPVMEKPSKVSVTAATDKMIANTLPSKEEMKLIETIVPKKPEQATPVKKKKRKEPNPLSVKKSKKKSTTKSSEEIKENSQQPAEESKQTEKDQDAEPPKKKARGRSKVKKSQKTGSIAASESTSANAGDDQTQ